MKKINTMQSAMLLSFVCGFSSLSIEILWIRLYSFAHESTPLGFGFIISSYLFGIACGAYFGGHSCKRKTNDELWVSSGFALLLSSATTFFFPQLFGWMFRHEVGGMLTDILLIATSSALLSYAFPIAHHLGTSTRKDASQGRNFSSVYMANIAGSASGPLITGYIFLEIKSLQQSFLILGIIQFLFGIILLIRNCKKENSKRIFTNISFATLSAAIFTIPLHGKQNYLIENVSKNTPLKKIIENRHGIISIAQGAGEDIIYGGNVYDGRTNVNLLRNTNYIHRLVLLSALKPNPRRVLMIGLSTGAWLTVMSNFPGIQDIDVIEINPGYLEAINDYPEIKNALSDARVNIHINDARRWLRARPDSKYDLIVMNSTWHWRVNNSFLLSTEMLQLLKSHMNEGALLAFNSTQSPDSFYTAASNFEHAYRYGNFVYAADFDFRDRKDNTDPIYFLKSSGWKGEDITALQRKIINSFFEYPFISIDEVFNETSRSLEIVTDFNMITEYKYGKKFTSRN